MPAKTTAPKPTVATAERKPRQPRTPKPDTGTETGQPAESTSGMKALDPMLQRHMKADAASRDLRIETMAHALIYDITSLRDVINQLHLMAGEDQPGKGIKRFLDYYVPRLEVLLEEDYLLGNIQALSDLGEWRLLDEAMGFEFPYYATIIGALSKPLEPSPAQMALLLERSARIEREQASRGETWIPKTSSRRASVK